MAVIATDTQRISNLVKKEFWEEVGYCRAVVTANEAAAKTYRVGEVLGKVTVGGKYKISLSGASDGSQTLDAICLEDKTVPATTDTKVLVLIKGPAVISKGALQFDASYNSGQKDTAYATLESRGIQVSETV